MERASMTIDEAVGKFLEIFRKYKKPLDLKKNFYCGITNDLDRRKGEHNVEYFLYYVKCNDFNSACELEEKLKEAGFDCGSETGHGKSNSIYVYIYRKTSVTTE